MSEGKNYWTGLRSRGLSRRRFVAGSGVLAAGTAAMLAGCGDDDDEPGGTSSATGTGTATAGGSATGTATASATSAGEVTKGGTLRGWKLAADPGADPAIYHLNNQEIVNTCFTQVMTYQVSKNEFAMDGMVSYEQVDETTVTWKVRPGMQFTNGDPVTAEDWAYSMTRIPTITKERRGHTGTPLFNYIESVTATDETTATMKMTRPNPSMPIHMARQYFAFINKKVAEAQPEKDVQTMPAGAGGGPFMVEKRDGTGTRLVRNPNYFKHEPADDGFNVDGPNLDAIEVRIISDRAGQKSAFLAGDLDMMGGIDAFEAEDFANNDNLTVAEIPNGAFAIGGFAHADLADTKARQALRMAVDYDAFIASLWGGKATYPAPVNVLLTSLQPFDQAKLKSFYKYDPGEAKKLWEAAGSPLTEIRILTGNDGQQGATISNFLQRSISDALGVNVVVDQVDPQTWAQRANAVPTKDWNILQSGTGFAGGTSGVPEDSSLIWFDPRGYGPLSFQFQTDSANPAIAAEAAAVQALMEKQEVELDVETRRGILAELQELIFANASLGMLLPVAGSALLAYNSRLQDVPVNDWNNYYYPYRRQTLWIKE